MAGILEAVASATEMFDIFQKNGGDAKAMLKAINNKNVSLIKNDGSIMKLLGNFIIEPLCVISKDLKEEDYIDSIIGLHTDLFSGLYLQAFEVLRTVHGIADNVIFDVLSTDKGGVGLAALKGLEVALEDVTGDYMSDLINGKLTLSTEDEDKRIPHNIYTRKANDKLEKYTTDGIYHDYDEKYHQLRDSRRKDDEFDHRLRRDQVTDEKDIANFRQKREEFEYKQHEDKMKRGDKVHNRSAGGVNQGMKDLLITNALQRNIEVEIIRKTSDGRRMATIIPITIKTNVIFTDADNITNTLAPNHDDKSFLSRLDDYRSGSISFMDFLFTADLVHAYKKNKLKDESDLLKITQSRKISANSKLAVSDMVGFEKHYTMYIISNEDKIRLEKYLRGKLSSKRVKQKFLDEAYGLSVTVVDRDYERVTIYYTDTNGSTNLSIKNVVKKEKNSGGDMTEIVKSLMNNKPPIF